MTVKDVERRVVAEVKKDWPSWIKALIALVVVTGSAVWVFQAQAADITQKTSDNAMAIEKNAAQIAMLTGALQPLSQLMTDVAVIQNTRWTGADAGRANLAIWNEIKDIRIEIASMPHAKDVPPPRFEKKVDDLAVTMHEVLQRLARIEARLNGD